MPSVQEFSVLVVKGNPRFLPKEIIRALEARTADANVILPFLKKALGSGGSTLPSLDQVWLCCITRDNGIDTVDMVLSCTENEMGKYPIFIVPTQPLSHWSLPSLRARLRALAHALSDTVPRERVYSVFAPDVIVFPFTQLWLELVGVEIIKEPYYSARLLSCTAVIPSPPLAPPLAATSLRPAIASDVEAVARLCFGFAQESGPFFLEREEAIKEATLLISKEQVWVHCIPGQGIACIAAFTRNTSDMATITKVYTHPSHRGLGYAKQLVREVTRNLLENNGKRQVVLYVAHNNPSAARVYESVGFTEPNSGDNSGHSVNWTEVGFDRNRVQLGHW
ncbi:acyl-CoA N-acyltransferase [Lentinula raphanica]|nr:acyl-CoA N-acyltransferase [Lentinula raphanica]